MTEFRIETTGTSNVLEACSRILGKRPTGLTPDAIAEIATNLEWQNCPGWEQQSDTDIAAGTRLLDVAFVGTILVVTEASLVGYNGAFVVAAGYLAELISKHLVLFGECFFNGDVLIAE